MMWFRQDLRVQDNPALVKACQQGTVIPLYILDDLNAGDVAMGEASRWWLHHTLQSLNASLNNQLNIISGNPLEIIPKLTQKYNIHAVYWNRCYEPWRIQRDKKIKYILKEKNIEVESFNASLLWEPWEINKNDGTPYKVFTPYYQRGCLNTITPREPINKPKLMELVSIDESMDLIQLNLLPTINWDASLKKRWSISETAAHKQLKSFLSDGINRYKEGRNFPTEHAISNLSPYLHFGQISPNQAWYAARALGINDNVKIFCSELGWREFSYYLLYHFPKLNKKNWNKKFDNFPWKKNKKALNAWQKGQTGYPIVDAGMRELWQTGFMHNRIRMVVASFLIKNCLIDWRDGEQWFWDCLVDADLASNSASWQWVAGCGADAAPYFRIFNPITQGQKFDKQGEYTKHYVPELAKLPIKYLFNPWDAPDEVLKTAGITLGKDYPKPIVDLKASRERALMAYQKIKGE